MRRAPLPDHLWSRPELAVATLFGAVGSLGVVVCWWGASGERTFEDEKDWLIGAILAAALIVLGVVILLLAGFRRLRAAKDDAVGRFLRAVPVVAVEYLGDELRHGSAADVAVSSGMGVR